MMNSQVIQVGARAVDVGYFNTKYTLGRKEAGQSVEIGVGMFSSLPYPPRQNSPVAAVELEGESRSDFLIVMKTHTGKHELQCVASCAV